MHARPLTTALAGAALALTALVGLTACSSSGSGSTAAPASEANLSGSPVSAKDDMTALCTQIIDQALPVEAADALAEAGGYVTRVSKVDGVDQAVTMDIREDRFTFEVKDGIVVGCTVG